MLRRRAGNITEKRQKGFHFSQHKVKRNKKMKVTIVIEKDQSGYYAFCPELKGSHSQGDTLEEVLANIKEAVELYIETLSPEERQAALAREILTTSVEVNVA